jgi:DNA-binding CsgD family transcriptional regulator
MSVDADDLHVKWSQSSVPSLVRTVLEACAGDDSGCMADTVVACVIADAVEVLIGLDRSDEAQKLVDMLERDGARPAWISAICARCRAMILAHLGQVDAACAGAQEALALHRAVVMPFERGRVQLLLGQLLRRQRRKAAAAVVLGEALNAFDKLGAESWSARTRAELDRACVVRSRQTMTPTEQQVAELSASGLTNREVAARLFVSPKTVEVNLYRVYRKLGVRSRAQLVGYMSRNEFRGAPAS